MSEIRCGGHCVDFFGGASLGALLGLLIGLSTTPVVSVVITGLVALLAGFFGLSEKLGGPASAAGTPRLIGFALCAAMFAIVGVVLRTHEILIPSIESQQADLRKLGYADKSSAQTELLLYVRYGLLPTGRTAATEHPPGGGELYIRPASNVCDGLSKARAPADIIQILAGADNHLKGVADKIKTLAAERQADVADVVKSALCPAN